VLLLEPVGLAAQAGSEARMGAKTRSWMSRFLGATVFGVVATVAIVGFAITRRAADREEEHLLEEQASEVATILSSSTSFDTSLQLIGEVYAGRGEAGPGFEAAAQSLIIGGVMTVGVAQVQGDQIVVVGMEGTGPEVGSALDDARGETARRAIAAGGLVSSVVHRDGLSVLLVAVGRTDGLIVFQETALPNGPLPREGVGPFQELDAALYRTPTADLANLLITTVESLPLEGHVDRRTLSFGTEEWLLETAARDALLSSQARAVPWIILVSGLAAAILAGGVVTLLARRRAYALNLVDERTHELRHTMAELEAARTAADTANTAKSQFLSRMSHELRTPLNAVLGFAQLLELREQSTEDREAVEHILKGGNHLLALINEVLDISRIEAGDMTLSPEPVHVADVVDEALALVRPMAAARSIALIHHPCGHHVLADRQRLKQVVLNLLSNGVKYNRFGGTVTVACEQLGEDRVRLHVTDTGQGLSADDIGRLFVPFERLGAASTDVEGTGIGLALSRRLAEAMGGRLEVDSTVGEGSTFWIELPRVEGTVERYERLAGAPLPPRVVVDRRHLVLYIEDNLANVTLAERVFAERGDIELMPVMQGRLGVDLARQHRPALILVDLHLPDIPGDEVLQQLRADPVTQPIPVIVVSADASPGRVERLRAAGATAYVTKPFDVRELIRTVGDILPMNGGGEANGDHEAVGTGVAPTATLRGDRRSPS
jgi:signal transduction histidine kinase/ActR/RegA family two-component response regulator